MKRRILPIILALMLCFSAILMTVVSAEQNGVITITFRPDDMPIAGAVFKIYLVAQQSGSGYALTGDFASYPVVLPDNEESDNWIAVASTLASYAARDGIEPNDQGMTGASGMVSFDGLDDGLYLIVGDPIIRDNVIYIPQPFLISMPYIDVYGVPTYNVSVQPKYEYRPITDETIDRHVVKVWEDNGYETERPQEIVVQLLCDGVVYDEQTLSAANNWQYTWTGLDPAHDWKIVEEFISGSYTVMVVEDGVTFTVINTIDNPPPTTPPVTPPTTPPATPPTTPPVTPSETPETTPPETPNVTPSYPPESPSEPPTTPETEPPVTEPGVPTEPPAPTPTPPPDLPHTGMLWWPVPVLFGAGILLLIAGAVIVIFRKGDRDDA